MPHGTWAIMKKCLVCYEITMFSYYMINIANNYE